MNLLKANKGHILILNVLMKPSESRSTDSNVSLSDLSKYMLISNDYADLECL